MKFEIHQGYFIYGLFIILGMITHSVYAQKINECQKNVDELVILFNQSIEEDRAEIIKSDAYQKKIRKLRACLRAYELESYGPEDSLRRINNEAIYNALATHYSKAIQVLRVLDLSLPDQQNIAYNRGQINLLNRKYGAAKADLTHTIQMQKSSLNLLVAMGLDKDSKLEVEQPPPPSSDDSKWYYNYSVYLNERGCTSDALRAISRAIAGDDKERYRLFKGDLYVQQGAFELAKKEFDQLSNQYKRVAVAYGNVYLGNNNFKAAQEQYLNYIRKGTSDLIGEAYLGLAHSSYGLKEWGQAQKYYRHAARYLPGDLSVTAGLANTYLSTSQYHSALKYFDLVLEKDSLYYPAYVGRALAYYSLGRYEEAIFNFEKANPIFDNHNLFQANWHTSKGLSYYQLGQFSKAINSFQTALEMDSNQFEALVGMSSVLIKQKKFPSAGEYLHKALQLVPTDDRLWSNYGNLLLHFGMFDKAYTVFKKAREINPRNISAVNGLSIALLEKDQIEKSLTLLDSIVRKNPSHSFLYNNLGIANIYAANKAVWLKNLKQGQKYYGQALADLNKALAIDTTKKFYHVNIGNVYRYTQTYDRADLHYRLHQDKSSLNNLAVVYGIQNNVKQANYFLDIAIQIDTSNKVFRYNKLRLNQVQPPSLQQGMMTHAIDYKYSLDGLVSINLYDYVYEEVKLKGRHINHLPLHVQPVHKYIPSFEFILEAYQHEKKKNRKISITNRKSQKVKMPKVRKKNATACPVL
jgi:tetratricopeptide (TPR) repeat protein